MLRCEVIDARVFLPIVMRIIEDILMHMHHMTNDRLLMCFRYMWMIHKEFARYFDESIFRPLVHPIDMCAIEWIVVIVANPPGKFGRCSAQYDMNICSAIGHKLIPCISVQIE